MKDIKEPDFGKEDIWVRDYNEAKVIDLAKHSKDKIYNAILKRGDPDQRISELQEENIRAFKANRRTGKAGYRTITPVSSLI